MYIYNEIAFKAFQSAAPLRELSGLTIRGVPNPKGKGKEKEKKTVRFKRQRLNMRCQRL